MKSVLSVLFLGVFLSGSGFAAAKITCQEVDELGDTLNTLGKQLIDDEVPIGEGSDLDESLAELTVALAEVADEYEDEEIGAGALAMASAWKKMDRDAFGDGLATVVAKLAIAYNANCTKK